MSWSLDKSYFWRDTPEETESNDLLLCKCGRYLDDDGNCPYCSGLISPEYDNYDCCNKNNYEL
jgi:hypothetical protein